MKVLPDLRQAQHRHADASGKHVERHELADGEIAAHHELGAEEQYRGDHELVDQLDCLARRVA